jgi:hypothetical protein
MFDILWWRYGWCGTLLGIYFVIALLANRQAPAGDPPNVRFTPPIRMLNAATMVAFYWLIRTTGHAVWQGVGNLVGVGLALGAIGFRWATRRGWPGLPYPGTVARLGFEAALPLAMGAFWGWLVLTLPACLIAAWSARAKS